VSLPLYLLENVSQAYSGRQVLRIERLAIERGEVLAVIGPSGAGKSTLLRLLNFLEQPASGTITFDAQSVQAPVPLAVRRRVTTVFQHPGLLNRTVAANLAYGLSLRKQKLPLEIQTQWLARLGLSDLARQRATRLSAGEAQRVALARALVIRPEVLLLDEPTANLDPYNVGLIETIVREENTRHGITIVLVTHNIFQARRLAHRTALLINGEIVEVAATEQFFERPSEARAAAFLRGDLVY
jgi:tungstate transport system ATP-binding protein